MNSFNLLFCIKSLTNIGGAERVFVEISNALSQKGHTVTVLSYDKDDAVSFYKLDPSIQWVKLGLGSTKNKANIFETLSRIKELRSIITNIRPQLVVGFMHSIFIPLGIALYGTNIPVIASEHIVPKHYSSRPIQALLLITTPLFVKRITCVSDQVRRAYPWFLRSKMVVIHNPVNNSIQSITRNYSDNENERVLLSIGRLEGQKDFALLVKSFANISPNHPKWKLRIIGEGSLRGSLEALIETTGMTGKIFMPGITNKIEEEYQNADLYVQPSLYESFGLTVAEALSSGLPAIAFENCQGVNQLIVSGVNGVLVKSEGSRKKALSRSLDNLMGNYELLAKFSANSSHTISKYTIGNITAEWEQLFKNYS